MITILTDSSAVRAVLDRYLLLPFGLPTGHPTKEVFRVTSTNGIYELHNATDLLAADRSLEAIIPVLQGFIDTAVVQQLTTLSAIHAGAVAYKNVAILFPGPSHSGKSTLVAGLLQRGFTYLSDEYALVDSAGLVHPYPRALMLREGRPDSRPFLASDSGAAIGREPAPAALLLSVQYRRGAAWDVHRIPQSDMLLHLLKSTPHTPQASPDLIPRLLSVSQKAACYAGIRGEAAESAEHILQLLSELSPVTK